jgi:hypothetical protein
MNNPLIVPSGWHLMQQIKMAEAKFDAARKAHIQDRFEAACAHNAKAIRDERAHDVRKHFNAGDRA